MSIKSRRLAKFTRTESRAGLLLFLAALLALIVDNTPLNSYYNAFFSFCLTLSLGALHLQKPLLLWINDGFMVIFFLLVGLEIKRELLEGELRCIDQALLPAIAALGGMLMPIVFFMTLNHHDPVAMRGWAIPTATDTAFSLAILALLGDRIPTSLRIFLTALAIFDDIGAITVMAIFYSNQISLMMLGIAIVLIILLFTMNYCGVRRLSPYFLVGTALWICVLKSGVHATLAGIIVAFAIPSSSLRRMEKRLHPWVAFGILPLFAFANAGVTFVGLNFSELIGPLSLGIALGLFLGKQLGIWGACMLAIRLNLVKMPQGINGFSIYGVALLAGVGFTMSLFIGSLAFGSLGGHYPVDVRLGVMMGSVLSGILGYFMLRHLYEIKKVTV